MKELWSVVEGWQDTAWWWRSSHDHLCISKKSGDLSREMVTKYVVWFKTSSHFGIDLR